MSVASVVDVAVRTSGLEGYVSSIVRAAHGYNLQSILAMGFTLSHSGSETIIKSRGVKHTIAVAFDPVRRIPWVEHSHAPSAIKNGVRFWFAWPDSARSILREARDGFLPLADTFSWLNPHRPCENSVRASVGSRRAPIFAIFSAQRGYRPRNLGTR